MTAITFDQFVALRVAIERGAGRSEVLRTRGLSAAQWAAAQRRWLGEMVREAERGGERYGARYRAAFMASDGPRELAPGVPEAVAPWRRAAMAQPPVATPPVPEPSADVTAVGGLKLADATLPFCNDAAVARAPAPVAHEVADEAADMVGSTRAVPVLSAEALGDEPSFDDGVAFADAADETSLLTAVPDPVDPLPFARFAAPAPPRALAEDLEPVGGETGLFPAVQDHEMAAPPFLRPRKSRDEAPADLSVEQYASLLVEVERLGTGDRSEILARYGLRSNDALTELARRWAEHFRSVPADYGRFRAAYDVYSQWLARGK